MPSPQTYQCPYPGCKHPPYVMIKRYQAHLLLCPCKPVDHPPLPQQATLLGLDDAPTIAPEIEKLDTLIKNLTKHRSVVPFAERIPKAARHQIATAFVQVIEQCLKQNDIDSWCSFFGFASRMFSLPDRSVDDKRSLTSKIKSNAQRNDIELRTTAGRPTPKPAGDSHLKRRVERKVNAGDITGAVRLLCSNDEVACRGPETLRALQDKHPPAHTGAAFPKLPDAVDTPAVSVEEVRRAVLAFPAGSASGFDGLTPQHVKDMLSCATISGELVCTALANLTTLMLRGEVPMRVCPYLYGANLTALNKKDGGIRPIAVGLTVRRIACKIVSARLLNDMGTLLRPNQLGCGTRGGVEVAVHAARAFCTNETDVCNVLWKIDIRNAFNCVRRDRILDAVAQHMPSYAPFVWQMYREPSTLLYGDDTLSSECGVQQGDPLGPLLFCLAIRSLSAAAGSPLNIWYLDDGAIGGTVDSVVDDYNRITDAALLLGLQLNANKCEFFVFGSDDAARANAVARLHEKAPACKFVSANELTLLGAPLLPDGIAQIVDEKCAALELMSSRLKMLQAHQALFLLRSSFGASKILYLLRTGQLWIYPEKLAAFDNILRSSLESITNVSMLDHVWEQATLPVRSGGLGIRLAAELAIPARLASVHAADHLLPTILSNIGCAGVALSPLNAWLHAAGGCEMPAIEQRGVQRCWDEPILRRRFDMLLELYPDQRVRIQASTAKSSGAWLNALPSHTIGTLLDDDALRISVALRLGAPVCYPHACHCGELVASDGYHGLKCRKSMGRHPRHASLNDVICRALVSAGMPSIPEPPGLARDDGKRPDGVTQFPWKNGRQMIWDATCVDTMAHASHGSYVPGKPAEQAERDKVRKYHDLLGAYHFVPVGFETFGPIGPSASEFLRELDRRLQQKTGEARSFEYLMQRTSLCVQRGNAVSVMGTRLQQRNLDDIFYVLGPRNASD